MASSSTSTLRSLTADLFVTLDGYAKGDHSSAYFGMLGPELEQWIKREMKQPQTVVMGRTTYETLAHNDDGTGTLAKMPKIMISRTLAEASWGETEIVSSDEALMALKRGSGPPLRIIGSVSLVQRLLRARGLDRLRLVVFPLLLGETGSEPTFANLPDLKLELQGTEVLDGRLVVLEYSSAVWRQADHRPPARRDGLRRPRRRGWPWVWVKAAGHGTGGLVRWARSIARCSVPPRRIARASASSAKRSSDLVGRERP